MSLEQPPLPPLQPEEIQQPATNLVAERIPQSEGKIILRAEELAGLVEAPALPACQLLWERNVRTTSATANRENPNASIEVDFGSLSDENKTIVTAIGRLTPRVDEHKTSESYSLDVMVAPNDTDQTVARKLYELADQLQSQPLLWAPGQSLDQLKVQYGYAADEQPRAEDFIAEGLGFDEASGLFYPSPELAQKARAYAESVNA